jgi:RNA polymerase sigma-70 factor (ECF subfamily)
MIFNENRKKIYNLAYRMLGNSEDAEDIVQETFYLAFKSYDNFRKDSNVYTWLYRICTNECLKKKTKSEDSIQFTGEYFDRYNTDENQEWANNPENAAQMRELTEYIRSECRHIVLQILTEEQRLVYIMRVILEMSYVDIAQALGISENIVKARLNRARNRLLNHFEKNCNWFKNRNNNCCAKKLGYVLSRDTEPLNRVSEVLTEIKPIENFDDKKEYVDYIFSRLPILEY